MGTETLERPVEDQKVKQPVENDKKWAWDRSKQSARNTIAADPYFIRVVETCVINDGASVTDAMRAVASNLELEAQHDHGHSPLMEQYLSLSQTDKRLIVRKILHTKYRAGEYKLVDATSTYRTGKKSGTKRYVLA